MMEWLVLSPPFEEPILKWDESTALAGARIERRKWDESKHPRDKEGQFTEVDAPETPVGKEIVERLLDSGVGSDYVHALYDTVDPLDAIATAMSMNTVRDADIAYARRIVQEKSQAMLRRLFGDKDLTVYRGFTGTEGKNDTISLTLQKSTALFHAREQGKRTGIMQEFKIPVSSVLSYGEAIGRGTFDEQEIIVPTATVIRAKKRDILWDESGVVEKRDYKRHPAGTPGSRGGEFATTGGTLVEDKLETLHSPKDALDSLLNNERDVSIDRNDVRRFLELAAEQFEDPDLTDLQVEGMEIFGGNGLGIERKDMPQIPRGEYRELFLSYAKAHGIEVEEDYVNPLDLKPTQNKISAREVGLKLAKYEKGDRVFPPIMVAKNNRILDGHHHWGMMAAYALEDASAKVPVHRFKSDTKAMLALMFAYMKLHGLKRKTLSGAAVKADPQTGRYVTPFVSFDRQGDDLIHMIASLNSSRLATWGFTAEAEVRGISRYRVSAVLDGRTSEFCRMINGKIFNVPDARQKVIEVLNVQNPEDLRQVQPWPRQTKQAMSEFRGMSAEQLTSRGLHIPPYHPYCRTLLLPVVASTGDLAEEDITQVLPAEVEMFQPISAADLKELGVEATPEQVDLWNTHVGMSPVELLSKLSGVEPRTVMTQGVGANSVQFDTAGNIALKARGEVAGVEFKLGALLDPFTGTYYLNYADLLAGTPQAEAKFLKRMFSELIGIGEASSTAKSLAVGVAGNAAYYAKIGFLPDDIDWDVIRYSTLESLETTLQPLMATLSAEDQMLVRHLLQDKSVRALSTLVDLPFSYGGRTFGEWILGDVGGTWALDLLDDALMAQAKDYLL